MFEIRWIYHDFKDGSPPHGSICVGDGPQTSYQKLQYRAIDSAGEWGEWRDVPHAGMPKVKAASLRPIYDGSGGGWAPYGGHPGRTGC